MLRWALAAVSVAATRYRAAVRVLVDALAARTGGGLTYLRSLLPHAAQADPELELLVAVSASNALGDLHGTAVEVAGVETVGRRVLWEQTRLESLARDVEADVIFAPSEIAPLRGEIPVILGFQNPNLFAPTLERDVRQYARLRLLRFAANLAARRADALVFVSEPFRRLAESRLPSTEAPRHTVTIWIDPSFTPKGSFGRFDALRPYLLSVSDVYRYKSLPVAIDAFAQLAQVHGDLRLLLAGRVVNHGASRRIDERIRAHRLEDRVIRLDSVPFEEMPQLYRGAMCFVFPSLLESLGLPPLEALACGVPVVAARASVMPELLGGAASYFAPGDPSDAARRVDEALGTAPPPAAAEVLFRHDALGSGAALAGVFRQTVARRSLR
jgi:glycosyltransferase involved in cell wall biosynthesis